MSQNQVYEDESLTDSKSNDVTDNEFIESYVALEDYRVEEDLEDLTYRKDEVKDVWIYPLTTLTGKTTAQGIRVANEKTTIMVTTPDKGQKIRVYLEQIKYFDLNEFVDPANPTEQLIKNSNNFNILTKEFENVNFDLLYLLTFEEINENNFDSLEKYLGKTITPTVTNKKLEMSFSPIDEFSSLFKAQPIKIVLTEPILEKIKEIHIQSPVGTLIGNIKVIDESGKQPSLLAKENTELFPNLVFPFQTQPHLSTVKYWASKQIIPFHEIFQFLDIKGIKYNEQFSLADFLKLGSPGPYPGLFVPSASKIKWTEKGETDTGRWEQIGTTGLYRWVSGPNAAYIETFERKEGEYYKNGRISYSPKGDAHVHVNKPNSIYDIEISPTGAGRVTSAFEAICQMLTESFWKDLEFPGATKIEVKDGQKIETINDNGIYELREKYSGQDRYAVTTNVWISWKRKNPDLVNANSEMIKRIENSIAMLSGVLKSNYSINKGDNDDYKVLLPYYFEIQNKLDNPTNFVYYKDIIVKMKSNYGNFTDKEFRFNHSNISKSKIFELEYNHFAFPELTKNPETAQIPSSMPLDQQLANGEYSKYKMFNFAKDFAAKKLYLNSYGSGNISYDPISNSLNNEGDFNLQLPVKISELEISAFYGYGSWMVKFVTTNDEEKIINLDLFSKFENTKTLINLIL